MKKIFLILICGLMIGCAGSNYGANATIKGKVFRAIDTPPGGVNSAEVLLEGKTGYTGQLSAVVDPVDGSFEININLGTESVGPPDTYVNSATVDLKLKINGYWWTADSTATEAEAFMTSVPIEAKQTKDIGVVVLSSAAWK